MEAKEVVMGVLAMAEATINSHNNNNPHALGVAALDI